MGFRQVMRDYNQHAPYQATYGAYGVLRGEFRHPIEGQFKPGVHPVAGCTAEYESGVDQGGRTTLTRVAAGAIIAGPVGAIVGGMFKKDRTKVYVTVTLPTGELVVIDGPAKDEQKLRQFAASINKAGAAYPLDS